MPGLTIRAYARHRGVSHTAVRKALASGRIRPEADGSIDPSRADEQWAVSTNLSKPRNSVIGEPKLRASTVERQPAHDNGSIVPLEGPTRLASSYAASRAARESYLARLARLDFEQRSGKLVDADEVRAQLFGLGRRLRDALMGVPDRLAPLLAGESNAAEVHRILSEELLAALAEVSAAPPLRVVGRQEPKP